MKTNHKERKQKEGVLFQRDLQPQRMNLTEGDVVMWCMCISRHLWEKEKMDGKKECRSES